MIAAPLPSTETQRLAALHGTSLLDTPAEPSFDDLTRLASQICGTPMAVISLVDQDRQWFKSRVGVEATETPRDIAFCAHTILNTEVMTVDDARCDARFHDNPLVTGPMGLRFYAGAPLDIGMGEHIGALCVLDIVPRQLDDAQREALAALARQVVAQIRLREKVIALQEATARQSLFEQQLQRFNEEMQTLVALRTRELQQARDRAELYFDVAGNMMVVTDVTGRIERANCRTGEVLRRPSSSLRGEDWFDLCFPAQERAAARAFFTGLIDAGSDSSRRFHGRVMTSDGQFRTVAWHTTRLVDERGLGIGLLGMGEDITDRLEAEEHLRRTLDELERSNMGLQQFVHVASHDLREPINSILNFAKLLARDRHEADSERIDRYIDFILRGGERLRTLVNDLLSFVRIDNSEARLDRVDLNESIEDTRQVLSDAIEKAGATLHVDPLPAVLGDRTLLGLLLQNLVSNALKFHRPGEAPVIRIRSESDEHELRIQVIDNGIGIADGFHEKIFGVFQRLHARSEYEGTGLGLALSRRIADMHGARLYVESEEGRGSCFVLALPLSACLPTAPLRMAAA
ncbi:MAG: PAS domain S-box protein [Methyloversatilis sp.]|nr:PAS domain S-box protein [Methyloversatilis sp.]